MENEIRHEPMHKDDNGENACNMNSNENVAVSPLDQQETTIVGTACSNSDGATEATEKSDEQSKIRMQNPYAEDPTARRRKRRRMQRLQHKRHIAIQQPPTKNSQSASGSTSTMTSMNTQNQQPRIVVGSSSKSDTILSPAAVPASQKKDAKRAVASVTPQQDIQPKTQTQAQAETALQLPPAPATFVIAERLPSRIVSYRSAVILTVSELYRVISTAATQVQQEQDTPSGALWKPCQCSIRTTGVLHRRINNHEWELTDPLVLNSGRKSGVATLRRSGPQQFNPYPKRNQQQEEEPAWKKQRNYFQQRKQQTVAQTRTTATGNATAGACATRKSSTKLKLDSIQQQQQQHQNRHIRPRWSDGFLIPKRPNMLHSKLSASSSGVSKLKPRGLHSRQVQDKEGVVRVHVQDATGYLMDDIQVGDLVMVIGELEPILKTLPAGLGGGNARETANSDDDESGNVTRQDANDSDNENAAETTTSTHKNNSPQVSCQYNLRARIVRQVNGTDMALLVRSLHLRRRHLARCCNPSGSKDALPSSTPLSFSGDDGQEDLTAKKRKECGFVGHGCGNQGCGLHAAVAHVASDGATSSSSHNVPR